MSKIDHSIMSKSDDAGADKQAPTGEVISITARPRSDGQIPTNLLNPTHMYNEGIIERLRNGDDPYAVERAKQTEVFNCMMELAEIKARQNALEAKMLKAATELSTLRGQGGGIPTIGNIHTILRFLPEVAPKKGK